ncbi:9900_t:CDS:2, partial [Scutellospora calospora]
LNLRHHRVCYLRNRVERGTGVHSNTIESTWGIIKKFISVIISQVVANCGV